jgi:hypothetical protein
MGTAKFNNSEKAQNKNVPHMHPMLNAEDACKLIEIGFEYITGEFNDGGKIFRKRK